MYRSHMACLLRVLIIALGSGVYISSYAYDLPEEMPVRKPGLWEMRKTGSMEGGATLSMKEQYCLDADADRALHELYILRKELEVIYADVDCVSPRIRATQDSVHGELSCRTNSQNDADNAGKDFEWDYSFKSDSHVVVHERSVARDMLFVGESEFVEQQNRIGECAADQQPGDGVMDRLGKRKAGEYDNIYESLKVVKKLLKEGKDINQRLGPM